MHGVCDRGFSKECDLVGGERSVCVWWWMVIVGGKRRIRRGVYRPALATGVLVCEVLVTGDERYDERRERRRGMQRG